MRIKLSDYILEQSVSTSSAIDIELEQLVAEMDVCCKLAMAYNKQLLMEDYFQEGTTTTTQTQNAQNAGAQAKAQPAVQSGAQPAPAATPAQPVQQAQPVQAKPTTQATPPTNNQQQTNQQSNQQNTQQTNAKQGFFASVWSYIEKFFKWIGARLKGTTADIKQSGQIVNNNIQKKTPDEVTRFITENKINIECYNPEKISTWVNDLNNAVNKFSSAFIQSIKGKKKKNTDPVSFVQQIEKCVEDFKVDIDKVKNTMNQPPQEGQDQVALLKSYIPEYIKKISSDESKTYTQVSNICKQLETMSDWVRYIKRGLDGREMGINLQTNGNDTIGQSGLTADAAKTKIGNIANGKNEENKKAVINSLRNVVLVIQNSKQYLDSIPANWNQLKKFAGIEQPQANSQ